MPQRDLDYLALQIEALFVHNALGHITATNEPSPQPAPRLFLGRTRTGNLWRLNADLPEATARTLTSLLAEEPISGDLRAPPRNRAALLATLDIAEAGAVITSGPAYFFPNDIGSLSSNGTDVRRLSYADIPLVDSMRGMGWTLDTLPDEFEGWEPMLALFEDKGVVALAFSARNTPRAAECGVDTLPAYRGRGFAPAVVAAWARTVRASGRVPLYSTSWENSASQAVARKLGLVQYGVDLSIF